jgi:hypothetical protein
MTFGIIAWLLFASAIVVGSNSNPYNPWIIIKTEDANFWIKRDKIVSVTENKDVDLLEHHGRTTIGLMNGQELHINKEVGEVIEEINK